MFARGTPSLARQCSSAKTLCSSRKLWYGPRSSASKNSSCRRMAASAGPSDVFVLDFDGVLVDSEPEVSKSAFDAAKDYWPAVFQPATDQQIDQLMSGMRQTRPVLVRGYESMVMARLLLEDPSNAQAILKDWPNLLTSTLARWGEDWTQLQAAFEQHRATWLSTDRQGWLDVNLPYPGVKETLTYCEYPFYIASSKAGKRVSTLLQEQLGLDIQQDSPRLFASLLPPEEKKAEALREIGQRPVCSETGARLHFVDDRLDTLTAVQQEGDLSRWQLYLADWGYNTAEERAAAAATPGIEVLSRQQFLELLKWGLLSGVDDGCEPTPEEVAAGVAAKLPKTK